MQKAGGFALSVFASQIRLTPHSVADATSLPGRGESVKGRGKKRCGQVLGSPSGRAGALAPERASTIKTKASVSLFIKIKNFDRFVMRLLFALFDFTLDFFKLDAIVVAPFCNSPFCAFVAMFTKTACIPRGICYTWCTMSYYWNRSVEPCAFMI